MYIIAVILVFKSYNISELNPYMSPAKLLINKDL